MRFKPSDSSFGPTSFKTEAATRAGAVMATTMVMMPPIEVPMNTASGMSSLSKSETTSWA